MSGDVPELVIAYRAVAELTADPRNARTHPQRQIDQIAASIRSFGFTNPVLIDESGRLIAGHGRMLAARAIGLARVPTITLAGLSAAQRRALMLADNRIAANAGWDMDVLKLELADLAELEFDLDLTGFAADEILLVLGDEVDLGKGLASGPSRAPASLDPAFPAPAPAPAPAPPTPFALSPSAPLRMNCVEGPRKNVAKHPSASLRANGGGGVPAVRTKAGDIWQVGAHRIGCGDVRDRDFVARLVGDAPVAGLVLTLAVDPAAVDAMVASFETGSRHAAARLLDPPQDDPSRPSRRAFDRLSPSSG